MGQLTQYMSAVIGVNNPQSIDFRLPLGSRITDVHVNQILSTTDTHFFAFGRDAFAAASVVPATHKCYCMAQVDCLFAGAQNTAHLSWHWENMFSLADTAFLYLNCTGGAQADVFVTITWVEPFKRQDPWESTLRPIPKMEVKNRG